MLETRETHAWCWMFRVGSLVSGRRVAWQFRRWRLITWFWWGDVLIEVLKWVQEVYTLAICVYDGDACCVVSPVVVSFPVPIFTRSTGKKVLVLLVPISHPHPARSPYGQGLYFVWTSHWLSYPPGAEPSELSVCFYCVYRMACRMCSYPERYPATCTSPVDRHVLAWLTTGMILTRPIEWCVELVRPPPSREMFCSGRICSCDCWTLDFRVGVPFFVQE